MSSVKKIVSLPPDAVKIFQEISSKKKITIDELKEITKLDHGKIEYNLGILVSNNLVRRVTDYKKKAILTETGLLAAKQQLVERRIIAVLKEKKSIPLTELSMHVECDNREMNAGIGFLKKDGIINIENGQVTLVKSDVDVSKELQEILVKISSGEEVELQLYGDVLLFRNLVTMEEVKIVSLEPLQKYKEIKEKIIETLDISRITPEMIRDGSWKSAKLREYNLNVSPPDFFIGRKQPYARFLDEVKRKLIGLGFQEMRGPIVELEFWNYDALFQAQDHSAREWSDVYTVAYPKKGNLPKEDYVKLVKKVHEDGYDTGSKGWRYKWDPAKSARLVLRSHGTSISARTLVDLPIPSKFFSISRCFRPDSVDVTHLAEFTQVEGIVADPSITFRDLLGILETFALDIADAKEYVFKPDYYPFTEPSVELSIIDPKLGSIEFGGAGIFRPEVTRPFGIDVPMIAWGLGIERLFMVKYGITDIRELFSHKLEWLRSERMS